MADAEFNLDVQTPGAAISEIAKGMSDLRDARKATVAVKSSETVDLYWAGCRTG
jgi:hypothetical protein